MPRSPTLLGQPGHELHVARHDGALVGYFELAGDELVFFGLTLAYVGRRIGPWLLDRAIERAFARGTTRLVLNTNTLDHPRALETYRRGGLSPGAQRSQGIAGSARAVARPLSLAAAAEPLCHSAIP